jgi:hypothetical protein
VFDDLVALDGVAVALHREGKNLHGDLFQFEDTISTTQLIAAAVELEFRKIALPRMARANPLGRD